MNTPRPICRANTCKGICNFDSATIMKGSSGKSGIFQLMITTQRRKRRYIVGLIYKKMQSSLIGTIVKSLSHPVGANLFVCGNLLNASARLITLCRNNRRCAYFENASLLAANLCDVTAKEMFMIACHRGDNSCGWLGYDIGGIKKPAQSCL